jgi:hypothetical protein
LYVHAHLAPTPPHFALFQFSTCLCSHEFCFSLSSCSMRLPNPMMCQIDFVLTPSCSMRLLNPATSWIDFVLAPSCSVRLPNPRMSQINCCSCSFLLYEIDYQTCKCLGLILFLLLLCEICQIHKCFRLIDFIPFLSIKSVLVLLSYTRNFLS